MRSNRQRKQIDGQRDVFWWNACQVRKHGYEFGLTALKPQRVELNTDALQFINEPSENVDGDAILAFPCVQETRLNDLCYRRHHWRFEICALKTLDCTTNFTFSPALYERVINRMHEGMVDVNVAEWGNRYSRRDRTPVNRVGPASNMKYENGLRHRARKVEFTWNRSTFDWTLAKCSFDQNP